MSNASFAAVLGGTVAGILLVGGATVFLATRQEGFHGSWAWRVHLRDFGRQWAIQILGPGSVWEDVAPTAAAYGREYAVATAKAAIDAR